MNPPDQVILTLRHPHGDIEITLKEWMATGPGARPLLEPVAARNSVDGSALSLGVIPLAYRNNLVSRTLIRLRLIPNPWVPER